MTRRRDEELGELLSAYLDDELKETERADVEKRLKSDAEVRAMLAELEQTAHLVRDLPAVNAPADVLEAITAQLEREALVAGMDSEVTLARHRRRPVRAILSVAAMLAVAIAGGVYVSQRLAQEPHDDQSLALNHKSESHTSDSLNDSRQFDTEKDALNSRETSPSARSQPSETAVPREWDSDESGILALRGRSDRGFASEPTDDASTDSSHVTILQSPTASPDASSRIIEETTKDMVAEMGYALGGKALRSKSLEQPPHAPGSSGGQDAMGASSAERMGGSEGNLASMAQSASGAMAQSETLEQRLLNGAQLAEVPTHRFDTEPVQLIARWDNQTEQQSAVNRLLANLDAVGAEPIETLLVDQTDVSKGKERSLVRRATRDASPPIRQTLWVRGMPNVNFLPQDPREEQLLVRVPASQLPTLLDALDIDHTANVSMRLGGVNEEGASAVRELTNEIVPQVDDAEAYSPIAWLDEVVQLFRQRGSSMLDDHFAERSSGAKASSMRRTRAPRTDATMAEGSSNGDAAVASELTNAPPTVAKEMSVGRGGQVSRGAAKQAVIAGAPLAEDPQGLITVVVQLLVDSNGVAPPNTDATTNP